MDEYLLTSTLSCDWSYSEGGLPLVWSHFTTSERFMSLFVNKLHVPLRLVAGCSRRSAVWPAFQKEWRNGRQRRREGCKQRRRRCGEEERGKAVPSLPLLFILKVCKVIKILLRLFSKRLFPHLFLPLPHPLALNNWSVHFSLHGRCTETISEAHQGRNREDPQSRVKVTMIYQQHLTRQFWAFRSI